MREPRRSVCAVRVLPVALCAMGGHVVLYGSLVPSDGSHGYLGWYESLVAALSLGSLLVLGGLVLASFFAGERVQASVSRIASQGPAQPPARRASRLALASAAFLVIQESVEQTLAAGHLSPASFSPGQSLLLLLSLGLLALVVARVEGWCRQLVEFVVRRVRVRGLHDDGLAVERPRTVGATKARRNPLAVSRGLRAPPLYA